MEQKKYSVTLGGKELVAEFNDLTGQASGSVMLTYGETVILVTAVMGGKEQVGLPYFPLSVEFEERHYAAGQILGSRFVRREGRPSDEAVLSARIVDRTIRPLFESFIRYDVQIVVTVLAIGEDDPDVLAVIGASLALHTSDIPWNGPVGVARIVKKKGADALIVNPTYTERNAEDLECEVFACGKDGTINMIETAGDEIPEATVVTALEKAKEIHAIVEAFQKTIQKEIGKEKRTLQKPEIPSELQKLFDTAIASKMTDAVFCSTPGKASIYALKDEWKEAIKGAELENIDPNTVDHMFEEAVDREIHRGALKEKKRADGRGLDDVRKLFAKAGGISPMLHGSGIFYRGETHMLSALTLGGPQDAQLIDSMETQDGSKRFMHHYNFPPFSVGETGRIGGFNRRMIGHGALAEKALVPVIPKKEDFPYTIRLVSETMSSNGSSSMGSVCGSTLALMDGGVPIKRPVAGIASGVMMGEEGVYTLLTDIQGPEDEHGDMDFKVAGTREGITAIQMDVKVDGIPIQILAEALEKAKLARLQILDVIEKEISAPRSDISPRAPKILTLTINPSKIGMVIGSGGKTINKIKEDTGVDEIAIEDDGSIFITGKDDTPAKAVVIIEAMTHDYQQGEEAEGVVTRIAPFGAFVALNEYAEGLVHVSEIAPFRIEKVEDVLKMGEHVPVVVKGTEEGKISLSIKARDPEWAKKKGIKPPERPTSR